MNTSKIPVIFLAFANDKVDNLAYLRNLPKEIHGIREALDMAQQAGLCEVVERTSATIEHILDIFQNQRYKDRIAIFHYGGHADGYQLLLEALDGSKSIAHGEGLVPFLARQKGLKLVFLNGCSSQQQALDLLNHGVPAVVGTSQSINDDIATSLSVRFYKGLANGATLEKSWLDAVDYIKTQTGISGKDNKEGNFRALYWKGRQEVENRLPWDLHIREGAEVVKIWNLPEEVNNPLFGLPEIPPYYQLPEEPFLFLRRYERPQAPVFFGRSYYIRDLYNRVHDRNAPPLILMYGQSGCGKSSLLEAGLIPRIENEYEVRYVRRMPDKGALGTLRMALGMEPVTESTQVAVIDHQERKLRKLYDVLDHLQEEDVDIRDTILHAIEKLRAARDKNCEDLKEVKENQRAGKPVTMLEHWKQIETGKEKAKPLIIILDQLEEIFTNPNPLFPDEFENFLDGLDEIFQEKVNAPLGKLILSYRKEFNPEIEEGFKYHKLPRNSLFLETLDSEDVIDVVTGMVRTSRLQSQYKITMDAELASVIADDLLEDKGSAVAPVLQILLTKMWRRALEENAEKPHFSVKTYQELRRQGLAMREFFDQQMQELALRLPDLVECGLALDLLKFHTTSLGTAQVRSKQEILAHYCNPEHNRSMALEKLTEELKELYLLTETSFNKDCTSLTHDTLAPVIIEEYTNSHRVGQRANRILTTKLYGITTYQKDIWLDEHDLEIVEKGRQGMRLLQTTEVELLQVSLQRKNRRETQRTQFVQIAIGIIAMLAGMAFFMSWEWFRNQPHKEKLASYHLIDQANTAFQQQDNNKTIFYAEKALQLALRSSRNDSARLAQYMQEHGVRHQHHIDISSFRSLHDREDSLQVSRHFASLLETLRNFGRRKPSDRQAVVSADGRFLLLFSNDSLLLKDQRQKKQQSFKYIAQPKIISQVIIADNGRTALIGYRDTTFARLDLMSHKQIPLVPKKGRALTAMFIPGSSTIVMQTLQKESFYWTADSDSTGRYPLNVYHVEQYPAGNALLAFTNEGLQMLSKDTNRWVRLETDHRFTMDELVKYQLAGWREKLQSGNFVDPLIWAFALVFLGIVLLNIFLELAMNRRWYLAIFMLLGLLAIISANWIVAYPDATPHDRLLLSVMFVTIPLTVAIYFALISWRQRRYVFVALPLGTALLLILFKIYHVSISQVDIDWIEAFYKTVIIFALIFLTTTCMALSLRRYYAKNYSPAFWWLGGSVVVIVAVSTYFQYVF